MKKILCFIVAISVMLCCGSVPALAESMPLVISLNSARESNNDNPYGIDLSSKECAIDGGLNANLVANGSFENQDQYWSFAGTNCVLGDNESIDQSNPTYDVVKVNETSIIKNYGYSADQKGAMGFVENKQYIFTCYIKNVDFSGEAYIQLEAKKNSNLVKLSTDAIGKQSWTKITATVGAAATDLGNLAITFTGKGSLQIDCVSLVAKDSYGNGNEEWKSAYLRADIVNAFKNLKPAFVIFNVPVQRWQESIGDSSSRGAGLEIGYHEYLQLCEDLNAQPIPKITLDDNASVEDCTQNALAMIEYANADSLTSYYGALRGGNGNDAGFDLKYIYLSGKGMGDIKSAIDEKFSNVMVLTDEDIASIGANTEYGSGATKNNMGAGLFDAMDMLAPASGFVAHKNALATDSEESSLIRIDQYGMALSPAYYEQMVLANNCGSEEIPTTQFDEKTSQYVSLDQGKQLLYITLVNQGDFSKSINISLDDFDMVNYVSSIDVSAGYKSASNILGKQRVAPKTEELTVEENTIEAKLEANSVTVIRVTYGNNTGENLYQIPEEIDCTTKMFIPLGIKVIITVLCVSVPVGTVIGFFIYKKLLSKKSKKKRDFE